MTVDIKLPPLPEPFTYVFPNVERNQLFHTKQMQDYARAAIKADRQQRGEPVKGPSDAEIREVFLASGFTIKPGNDDLKPYVYKAARALLARYGQTTEPEGWRLVPKIPTVEVIAAMREAIAYDQETTGSVYAAMLEAAPKFGEEE